MRCVFWGKPVKLAAVDILEATHRLRRLRPVQELARFCCKWQVFVTGGTVRDALLGLPLRELDLAVLGDAEACARQLAQGLGGTFFPLGRKPLSTYRVVAGRFPVDVWSVPGSLEEDILRRDFTVNALFFQLPSGPLLDLAGGLRDLAAGKLEVVRRENLFSDPLRVLRGLRLSLTLPLHLSQRSAQLLREASAELPRVARERIREEVDKILAQAPLSAAWQRGLSLGIWQALGVAPQREGPDPGPILQRLQQLREKPGPWGQAAGQLLWAGLALARILAGQPVQEALAAALVPLGVYGRKLAQLSQLADLGEQLRLKANARALLACVSPQRAVLAWFFARNPETSWPEVHRLWRWWVTFSRKPPLVSSQEVVTLLGLPPGPARGQAIRRLRQLQAMGTLRTPGAARRYLEEHLKPQA